MEKISYGLMNNTVISQQNWNLNDFSQSQSQDITAYSENLKHSDGHNRKSVLSQTIEMTIEELSYNFMHCKLSPILDKNTDQDKNNNIFALAEAMSFSEDDITFLRNCYAGGGDPAGDFLTTMVTELYDTPVSELRVVLKQKGLPPKALETISSYSNDDILDDILPLDMDNLAVKLTTHGKTIYDWEYVAEKFGYFDKISLFKSAIKRNNIMSPTMALMDLIKTKKPQTKVTELIKHLEKIGNKKAVLAVKQQVSEQ